MIDEWDHQEFAVLLDRAHEGDDAAFGTLYEKTAPMAHRVAQHIVRDRHAADDLVQETFCLVLNAVRAGRGPRSSFPGYVLSTVRRLAYRHSTARGRTIAVHDPAAWDALIDRLGVPRADDGRAATALAGLPARWRLVLWLVDVERYSPSEVGTRLSMTPNAVSSLAARARKALRAAYAAAPADV
ncbi:sigma-70 family RNA polymerase sigma factor [Jiangella ureilytica]|uniref:Sigma-70 family RNA polymerase sigma factor n=1 Tax=Jiangella ureilytica TaxID=2530374 RepID=A0A4R4RH06_9ACTN|nr:sigma-70 family RNA polymerase sigma factor [Jiangella ureilytica]TDC48731.1 sigma-70 family RNA polymerase sigma factor [Jiangella ureilytica]